MFITKISPIFRGDFLVYGLFLILEYPEFLQKIGHDEEGEIHGYADDDRGELFPDLFGEKFLPKFFAKTQYIVCLPIDKHEIV